MTGACFVLSFSTLPYSLKILLQKLINFLLDSTGLVCFLYSYLLPERSGEMRKWFASYFTHEQRHEEEKFT